MRYRWRSLRIIIVPLEIAIDARVAPSRVLLARARNVRAWCDDRRDALFREEVDAAVCEDGRGGKRTVEPLLPENGSGLGIDTARDAVIAHDVQLIGDEQRRGRQRRAALERPRDMAVRHVARPIGPHRHDRRLVEPGREKDEAVAVDRARDVGEPVAVAHPPDLFAVHGVVGRGPERTDADHLVAIADTNDERRGVRLVGRKATRRLPFHFSRIRIDSHDKGLVAAVAAEDQEAGVEDRGSATAVLRVIRKPCLPHDLAGGCQGGGSVGAEVHVDAIAVQDGRGRGPAVLGVLRSCTAHAKRLDVDELPPAREIERHHS